MKTRFLLFIKMIAAGVISIVILSLFTLVYNYSGVHIQNPSGATDYTWESGQWKATMTEGIAWLHMDENGFNNMLTSEEKQTDILLMGSSNMEAVEVSAGENTGYLLNQMLPELHTYNIGMSGHVIYNCVNNMENAVRAFNPEKYVILETNSVKLRSDDMEKVIGGGYPRIPSYDDGILYLLQKKVPAVKFIYKQLDDWKSTESRGDESKEIEETDYRSSEYKNTLDAFLEKAVAPARECSAKLIIFYHPLTILAKDGSLIFDTDKDVLSVFESSCRKNDILFVDLTEDFVSLYERQYKLPYGFINSEVGNGHLNRYGHRVIADRLRDVILAQEEKDGEV